MRTNSLARWLFSYSLTGAALLAGTALSASATQWTSTVIGGTDCNSQDNFTNPTCPAKPNKTCSSTYNACNQGSGNATKICQSQAGNEACTGNSNCSSRKHDTLSDTDAAGMACTPKQI